VRFTIVVGDAYTERLRRRCEEVGVARQAYCGRIIEMVLDNLETFSTLDLTTAAGEGLPEPAEEPEDARLMPDEVRIVQLEEVLRSREALLAERDARIRDLQAEVQRLDTYVMQEKGEKHELYLRLPAPEAQTVGFWERLFGRRRG
jgi:hypothetical protein